jgi:hypothetical protein
MPTINQYPQLKADDGSDNVNFTQAGSNAATRSVQDKLRDMVSAKDFGAVGDGTTDDAVALQAALDYVSQNGLTLYIPSGNYTIETGLTITGRDNWSIVGDGMYISKIIRNSFACGTVLNIVSCEHVVVKDLGFDGGWATYNGGSANHAFVFNDCENVRGENLYATDFKNGGVNGFVTNGTQKRNIRFIGCEVDGLGAANNGINIANGIESGMIDCHVKGCPGSPGYGLQLKNVCERSYIRSSWVEGCTAGVAFGNDISATGVTKCSVTDVQIYDCRSAIATGYASDNLFDSIQIDMNNIVGWGIDLANGSGNNSFRNITGRNINNTRSLIRVRAGDYNTFDVSMLVNPTVLSGTLGTIDSGVQYTRINLGQVVTAGYSPWTRLVDDNSTNNTNTFLINHEPRVELHSIASGAVSLVTGGVRILRIDTEGAAATDDLDNILGVLPDNQYVYLQSSADGRDITVRDAGVSGGNIQLAGGSPMTLAKRGDSLGLMWKEGVGAWCEISRSTV